MILLVPCRENPGSVGFSTRLKLAKGKKEFSVTWPPPQPWEQRNAS